MSNHRSIGALVGPRQSQIRVRLRAEDCIDYLLRELAVAIRWVERLRAPTSITDASTVAATLRAAESCVNRRAQVVGRPASTRGLGGPPSALAQSGAAWMWFVDGDIVY